ncbi:hypothetical protein [Dyella sp. 2RAB6]|uniref:hypothetical protein n=1 Tax=Dyella sp. 2RAB6 TaxID=3232992 RepID=UPI003F903E33
MPAAMLLCAAFGLALAFAPRRVWLACVGLVALSAMLGFALKLPRAAIDLVFLCGWLSVIACAATVHLRSGLPSPLALLLAIDAGAWSGAMIAFEGRWLHLPAAWLCMLALVPAALAVRWRLPIAAKVISSWLIAIAVLAAALPYLPVTPGYLPDHLE